ncbi:MAG: FAD-binding oxidoreductase [Candidatus Yanofskybacteria bacterium]|nr:FAD-binding oxidoreductase [Candidatus Yanofskybacteria bacterium]
MKKGGHKVRDAFSAMSLDQTDFGRIYSNLPHVTEAPTTLEELALTLKKYHQNGTPVTIRNTGHSVNGQTLTKGAQVRVGNIKHLSFDKERMEVSCGAGVSWDEMLKAIGFPAFCPPVFPNNPGQQIHVTGNVAVGGIGFYGARQGGLWNHVRRIKLVTMKGEIITCSPEENPEYFYYSLGGFGRIGVIGELTLGVKPSSSLTLGMILAYVNRDTYHQDTRKIVRDSSVSGVMMLEFFGLLKPVLGMGVFVDVRNETERGALAQEITDKYQEGLRVHIKGAVPHSMDIGARTHHLKKLQVVYFYPQFDGEIQLDRCHPWGDYAVPEGRYRDFMAFVKSAISKYKMEKYLIRETGFHHQLDAPLLGTYPIRRITDTFPLTLDIPGEEYGFAVSILPTVPSQEVDRATAMNQVIIDAVYGMGGRMYLYGLHQLTKKQIQRHFGSSVLEQWQNIKDELDPKHLLNIGVIEHLD